ncbi:MAG: hypothetical protein V4530_09360 [Pseudomonadota bacterium]
MAQSAEDRARDLAAQCRRQAAASDTDGVREILNKMADDYERLAEKYAQLRDESEAD